MNNNQYTDAVLILGMHRSGTSATAGALSKLGVDLGERLLPPGEDNPKGYWEHQVAVDIDEDLLQALGRSWDDPNEMPENWQTSDSALVATKSIERFAGSFANSPVWAVKDPRMCRLLPVWRAGLASAGASAKALIVLRHPAEVAKSLRVRNGLNENIGHLLWIRHVLEAERHSRKMARTLLTYHDLLGDAQNVLARAMSELGAVVKTESTNDLLSSFIDHADRHHTDTSINRDEYIQVFADNIYCSLIRSPDSINNFAQFDLHNEELARYWAPIKNVSEFLSVKAAEERKRAAIIKARTERLQSEISAQMQWSEQAVEREQELQAEVARLKSELRAQVIWSECAVEREQQLQAETAQLQSELRAQVEWSEKAALRQHELQAETAHIQSELRAQLAWSEQAVQREQKLQAQAAQLQSDLHAQLAWSEQAVQREQKLQAHAAQLQSDLYAQVAWSERAATTEQQLRSQLAEMQSKLKAQIDWSEEAVLREERMHLKVAELESKLYAQIQWSESAVQQMHHLQHELTKSVYDKKVADENLVAITESWSWRATMPLRRLKSFFRSGLHSLTIY